MSAQELFLSKQEKLLLMDGYCRKNKKNQQYISIDLCNIIGQFLKNNFILDFIVIFEKINDFYIDGIFCYDINSQTIAIKTNKIWSRTGGLSYCIYETIDDYFIYRIGSEPGYTAPNIK